MISQRVLLTVRLPASISCHTWWGGCLCQRPDVVRFQSTLPPLFDGWAVVCLRLTRNERASDGGVSTGTKQGIGLLLIQCPCVVTHVGDWGFCSMQNAEAMTIECSSFKPLRSSIHLLGRHLHNLPEPRESSTLVPVASRLQGSLRS